MLGCDLEDPDPADNRSKRPLDDQRWQKLEAYRSHWQDSVPRKNQAWLYRLRFINYNRILAVDEFGDCQHENPHLLVEFDPEHGPFNQRVVENIDIEDIGFWRRFRATPETRIVFFPEEFRSAANGNAAIGAE